MIRIGIIGAGPNAAGHAQYFHVSPRTEVIAIADPDSARANTLAEQCQAESLSDYKDFIDKVDAVVISSPNFLHKEQAIFCADAGKHVYCEKPMGLSQADAQEIADAVARAGVKSTVGFSVRFDGGVQTMQRYAREGRLGTLVSLCSRRLMYMSPASSGWRADHALSGGLLFEINIHEIDWMMSVGGEIESVYARTWALNPAGPRSNDHLWVTLNFAGTAVGQHEGSWLSPNPQFFRSISGTEGGLSTDEWGGTLFEAQMGKDREQITPDPSFDLRGHFLDMIEHNVAPVADVHWGLKVMAVCDGIFESAATGLPVRIKKS